jgi:AraC-like DNA-binding protein
MCAAIRYQICQMAEVVPNALAASANEQTLTLEFYYTHNHPTNEDPQHYHAQNTSNRLIFEFDFEHLQSAGFELGFLQGILSKTEHYLCCDCQMLLYQILHTKYTGVFKQIFVESKAMELFLCTFHPEEGEVGGCGFLNQPVEKFKIETAKQIILQNLAHPLTIPHLSQKVGINQCYLKKGFKELFGSTISEFVQTQRMLKARILLSSQNYTVSEVAQAIGYSNVSNFSNAFRKYTGVCPSELNKN